MDSGGVDMGLTGSDKTHSGFTAVASGVGCKSASNPTAELSCMRGISAAAIIKAAAAGGGPFGGRMFGPVVDEKIVFSDYAKRAANGRMLAVVCGYRTGMFRGNEAKTVTASDYRV